MVCLLRDDPSGIAIWCGEHHQDGNHDEDKRPVLMGELRLSPPPCVWNKVDSNHQSPSEPGRYVRRLSPASTGLAFFWPERFPAATTSNTRSERPGATLNMGAILIK